MKKFYCLVILILTNLTILIISSTNVNAQPFTNTERSLGLEPSIERYNYSESFGGSDSAWINLTKRTRIFNQNNQVDKFEQMKWDSIDWIEEMKWDYNYSGDLLTMLNTFSWGDEGWKESGKSEFAYDASRRVISNTNSYLNEEQEWVIASISLTSYDDSGRVSEILNYRNQGYMADTTKMVFTYDSVGNLIELLNQKYMNGEFSNQNVTKYYYENSNLISQENMFWYSTQLYYDNKDSIFYDEFGRRTSRLHYKYYDGDYSKDYRYIWTFDENDRIIEETYQDWEAIDWADPWKNTMTYDEAGNLIERFKKQLRNGNWTNKEITHLTFNTSNQLTDFSYYIWIVDDWQRSVKFTYEHEPLEVEENLFIKNELINFPNPFSNETTIIFSLDKSTDVNISIYDINGKILKSEVLKGLASGEQQYKFNSGNLPSGIYLYRIENGREQYFNSFVINK